MQIAGATLSKTAAEKIAREALRIADEKGYCSEVEDFLEDMGFPIPSITRKVTLEVEVIGRGDVTSTWDWSVVGPTEDTNTLRIVKVEEVS